MKKVLFLALFCLAAVACGSLKIVLNTKDSDGKRIYCTSDLRLFGYSGSDVYAAMGAKVGDRDTLLAVVITCNKDSDHGIFNEGDKMMIRLRDSTVITLINLYDKEYEVETNTVQTSDPVIFRGYDYCYSPWTDNIFIAPYDVRAFVSRTSITKTTNSYALYLITKEQIQAIMDQEVIKLRIEIEDRDIEMTYPQNASGIFTQLYTFLHDNVRNGVVRSEF